MPLPVPASKRQALASTKAFKKGCSSQAGLLESRGKAKHPFGVAMRYPVHHGGVQVGQQAFAQGTHHLIVLGPVVGVIDGHHEPVRVVFNQLFPVWGQVGRAPRRGRPEDGAFREPSEIVGLLRQAAVAQIADHVGVLFKEGTYVLGCGGFAAV